MILSSISCIAVIVARCVIYTEAIPASKSSYSVIVTIRFNDTICKIENGVLSINGKVIGNLTDDQKQELKDYIAQTERWYNQLHRKIEEIFKHFFEWIKKTWDDAWISGSKPSIPDKLDQEYSNDSSFLGNLTPPSFCKVK